MIRLSANQAGFNELLRRQLARAKNPQAVLMTAGREFSNQLKKWFRKKEQTDHNKLSERREHFWLQVSRTVNNPVQTGYNTVSVTVSDPRIAQKVFGGTILPKRASALTIPVSEKAYGRTASTFEAETGLKLFVLGSKDHDRGGVLATMVEGQVEIEYVLSKGVDQAADPTALPDMKEVERKVVERAQKVADRQEAGV